MGHLNMKGLSLEASFSPDGQYVLSGERLLLMFEVSEDYRSLFAVLHVKQSNCTVA